MSLAMNELAAAMLQAQHQDFSEMPWRRGLLALAANVVEMLQRRMHVVHACRHLASMRLAD